MNDYSLSNKKIIKNIKISIYYFVKMVYDIKDNGNLYLIVYKYEVKICLLILLKSK